MGTHFPASLALAAWLGVGLVVAQPSAAAAAPQPAAQPDRAASGAQPASARAPNDAPKDAAEPPADADGVSAQLARVEKEAQSLSPPQAVARPVAEARRALRRSRGARASGDEPHAAQLDRLAADWLEIASATVRALRAEQAAKTESARAQELGLKLDRGRALQAEQQARKGRLLAEAQRLEQQAANPDVGAEPGPAAGSPGRGKTPAGHGPGR